MTSDTAASAPRRETNSRYVIRCDDRRPLLNLPELWAYRELAYALIWREIKVRYAQTLVGVGWVVLQPVLTTVVLTLLAGRWMKVPTDGLPYPLFAYSGLVPWIYVTHVVTKSSISLTNTGLLSKAYFPRLWLPLSAALGALIDLFAAGAILALLMTYYRAVPGINLLLLPFCVMLTTMVAFGAGVWIAVLNLYYRDVSHALPFVTQLVFFMTPVAYSIRLVPGSMRLIYSLNPVVAVIECWRWVLFGKPLTISLPQLATSLAAAAAVMMSGLLYFNRKEPVLADVGDV